jgi:hypothetical protein
VLFCRTALSSDPIRRAFDLSEQSSEHGKDLSQMQSASNYVPNNSGAFSNEEARNAEERSACANQSTMLHNTGDERAQFQHVHIGRVQGQTPTDHTQVVEDTNRLFDELLMLATDQDLEFDQQKWIQKGYFAFCEKTSFPSSESELLVRRARSSPSTCASNGVDMPPPVHRVRTRPSGACLRMGGK